MITSKTAIKSGNEAAAFIAYKINEVFPIYPITPASGMSELVEQWAAEGRKNIFGSTPEVIVMQSEGGVAGALHGALQTGGLGSTFTASQGLLLMAPNMYKMAGELTPHIIHVATRSIATHALSVFGDHSDIMAVRQTGYAFLGACNVQETMDFALISQIASLKSRIPFVHFFDGFQTSHEHTTVELISDEVIKELLPNESIIAHRTRALTPNNPVIRGTSQEADVFFQSREAINSFYDACPNIVQESMDQFALCTGRSYKIFEYVGHPEAEHVIIAMASACDVIEETIEHLNLEGNRYGLIKVRLFRPFSSKHLMEALPKACKTISVLDRCKEPGADGEPLYKDVSASIFRSQVNGSLAPGIKVVGGRFGLSSKEITPHLVQSVLKNGGLKMPQNNFTVGIEDDITFLNLPSSPSPLKLDDLSEILFLEKEAQDQFPIQNLMKFIHLTSRKHTQGFVNCNYDKSNLNQQVNFRYGSKPIKAHYEIASANFVVCDDILKLTTKILSNLKPEATILIHSDRNYKTLKLNISEETKQQLINKGVSMYVVDVNKLKTSYRYGSLKLSPLQACYVMLNPQFALKTQWHSIYLHLEHVALSKVSILPTLNTKSETSNELIYKLLEGNGNEVPVSLLPVDGTFPTNTSQYNTSQNGAFLPEWNPNRCIQCGACSIACPQSAIRMKIFNASQLEEAPPTFKSSYAYDWVDDMDLLRFTLQVNPDQCTSCEQCIEVCPVSALNLVHREEVKSEQLSNWNYSESFLEIDRSKIDPTDLKQQQLQEPLFKYPRGSVGCGEAPYLKVLSQLFGDRLLIANATGSSSILGGALPTTPWSKNKEGRGPAWSNSLFEDNAEFGLGFRLTLDQQKNHCIQKLNALKDKIDPYLIDTICASKQQTESELQLQRNRVAQLKSILRRLNTLEASQIIPLLDSLVDTSIWMVGGDGWAYDIGFGGLDHVLASGRNVNILVLDNEVYDNTGGQISKSTPMGAQAKFGFSGKTKQKKDLGAMAMCYEDVYVASISIGANPEQTLKVFKEANEHKGPSLIIAYCHSTAHGIDLKNPARLHKAAVASGRWLLYRNNPNRINKGLNSFQLDSSEPSIQLEDYLKMEKRFQKLLSLNQEDLLPILDTMQRKLTDRYYQYKSLNDSKPKGVNRDVLLYV